MESSKLYLRVMNKTHEECIALLEQIRWGAQPICPYCGARQASKIKSETRYHCNNCYTSYSVTVGTLFHRTHIRMDKWFAAITYIRSKSLPTSIRELAREVGISKKGASSILRRINNADRNQMALLRKIADKLQEEDSN